MLESMAILISRFCRLLTVPLSGGKNTLRSPFRTVMSPCLPPMIRAKASWLGLSVMAGVLAVGAAEPNSAATPALTPPSINLFPDKVVAQGKGFEIKRSQVEDAFTAYKASAAAQGQALPESKRSELEEQVLSRLINTRLLLDRATVADQAQAKELAEKTYTEYKGRMPSEDAFKRQIVALGMSLEQFRSRILEEATFRAVIDRELKAKITIAEEQAREYYTNNPARFDLPDRVRASHILFLIIDPLTRKELPDAQKTKKKDLAEKILARVKAGEDFAKLAKEYSEDPGSRDRGGELPAFAHGNMVPEFEEAAFGLAPNQISGLVPTKFGFHIIKMFEKMPARKIPFTEASPDIKGFLAVQEAQKQLPDFLKKLRAEAEVQILEPPAKP